MKYVIGPFVFNIISSTSPAVTKFQIIGHFTFYATDIKDFEWLLPRMLLNQNVLHLGLSLNISLSIKPSAAILAISCPLSHSVSYFLLYFPNT